MIVWSNERLVKWIQSIGLKDYANNLSQSGVHGGILALDDSYDWQQLALALKIPIHDIISRQIVETEFKHFILDNRRRYLENVSH